MSPNDIADEQQTDSDPGTVGVVGAGIVGLAAAYYLAERGVTVTVYEQGSIGYGSGPLAVGDIHARYDREADIRMMLASGSVWKHSDEVFGTDVGYTQTGSLVGLRNDDQVEVVCDTVLTQHSLGLETTVEDHTAVADHCPGFDPEPFTVETYSPTGGYVDPQRAMLAFERAAEDAGVDLRTETEVVDLRQTADGAVTGVVTESGVTATDAVVNAAGAWAPYLSESAGVDLPIEPRARRAAVVEPVHLPREDIPLVVDFDSGVYFRRTDGERMLVGGRFDLPGSDGDGTDARITLDPATDTAAPIEWQWEAIERAADCASYFGPGTRVVESREGRAAVTPDGNPIIERSRPGLFTAAGFSGYGFMLAPAAGQLVTDLVVEGETDILDPAAYSRTRFADDSDRTRTAALF
ncbi:NAD(P)/FAD-dependent oxidoreductase [Haloarcula sediminis]|uniref:NAD(P)/FAD-dependent oxidoreductase n=1 Tax=Haloarcula sediminis TaxID=3111777 RepID=UPI002D77B23B|nr:FAD-dependent oxidoreductase [Haloarcula sp. CK38]